MIRDFEGFSYCCPTAGLAEQRYYGLHKPSRKEVASAAEEAFDKLWYARHLEIGSPEAGQESAKQIEIEYGTEALTLCEECLLRMEGRPGALRWILDGAFIENYDT